MDSIEVFLWCVVVSAVSFLIGIMVGVGSTNEAEKVKAGEA